MTKYIKDTNKQYSINTNGEVIIHYRRKRITNTRMDKIQCNVILTTHNNNTTVNIVVNNKPRTLSVNKLLIEYFGFGYCKQCNTKFTPDISPIKCNKCRRANRAKTVKQDCIKHRDRRLETGRQYMKLSCKNLSNGYIYNCLNLPIDTMPVELINAKRQQLKLHRHVTN